MIAWLLACAPPGERSADACGSCHEEEHAAWSASAHGRGPSDAVLAWQPEVERAWGEVAAARCGGCHEPGFVPGETVGCVACHGAVGNHAESDGALVVDLKAPLSGQSREAPHELAHRPFLSASALCATCHEVTGPALLVETTGSEHRAWGGPETCADCHLEGHSFDARRGEGLALELTVDRGIAVVSVGNVGAGHAVPTGPAVVRDVWVDLSFAERVLELGPRPARGGVEVDLLTEADGTLGAALGPGEWRTVEVALPPGAEPATVEATLSSARFTQRFAAALGLPDVEREARRTARASLP